MDLAAENRPQIEVNTSGVMINVELLLIFAIVLVSAGLRLFSLGVPAMTDAEAFSALAAWRATIPDAAGSDLVASSPVLFWAQSLSFGLLGGSEMAARLLTAVAGTALSVSPLLFRPILGQSRAWTMTLLLVFSPVVLGASRFSGPAVWASLFAVVMLWAFWRYWRDGSSPHGVMTIVFGALLVLFSEPGIGRAHV
jgi:predicted membrane-bound mannosyltransferase